MDMWLVTDSGNVTVKLGGRFDGDVGFDFHTLVARGMTKSAAHEVVIDMENVAYIDSAALGKLIDVGKSIDKSGRRLTITNAQPPIRKVFSLVGLEKIARIA